MNSSFALAQLANVRGTLACILVALAALFLAQNYGAPVMLFALLLGMSVNFLHEHEDCARGIDFCATSVLRFGVALLGARILAGDILSLGWGIALMVVAGVILTIAFGALAARLLGLDHRLGLLSGGAVGICGISAAMTLASVMPRNRDTECYTLLTVIMVATFGAVAMVVYPVIARAFGLDAVAAGIFIGGAIHDVSHVVRRQLQYSPAGRGRCHDRQDVAGDLAGPCGLAVRGPVAGPGYYRS